MDEATFAAVHAAAHSNKLVLPDDAKWSVEQLREALFQTEQRAIKAEKKLEALELVASYAKDVVDFWPSMSMRTIRIMMPKMDALKESLNLVK